MLEGSRRNRDEHEIAYETPALRVLLRSSTGSVEVGGGGEKIFEEEGNGLENRQSNINKHRKTEKHSYSGLRLASAVTRSTGKKTAWPREERAPRMHWMAERSRAKEMVHLSQRIVRL